MKSVNKSFAHDTTVPIRSWDPINDDPTKEVPLMEIYNAKCATAAKPRLAMPIAATAGVVAPWAGVTVRKHAAFGTRFTGLPAWSPPTC